MTIDIDRDTLRAQSKLFALLDEPGEDRLLALAQEARFDDDAIVIEEGDQGDWFFVVRQGTAVVLIDDDMGGKREVARLGQGAFVGEIGALMGEPRSATVQAKDGLSVLRFDAAPVQVLLEDYKSVREALVKLALQRSEDTLQEMLRIDDLPAPETDGDG